MTSLTNWAVLLDQLKEKEHLRSDAQLGESLGVTRGFVCAIRKGRRSMPLDKAKIVFSRLEIHPDPTTLAYLLSGQRVKNYLAEVDNQSSAKANVN